MNSISLEAQYKNLNIVYQNTQKAMICSRQYRAAVVKIARISSQT